MVSNPQTQEVWLQVLEYGRKGIRVDLVEYVLYVLNPKATNKDKGKSGRDKALNVIAKGSKTHAITSFLSLISTRSLAVLWRKT